MAGNVLFSYPANSVAPAIATGFHSMAASQTLVSGWGSDSFDNYTTTNDLDLAVGANFVSHASNRQAGTIEVWILAALAVIGGAAVYPTPASGTIGVSGGGTVTFTAREQLEAFGQRLTRITALATASQPYWVPAMGIAALFNGFPPPFWTIFVTHNIATSTNAGLASSGSIIYYTRGENRYT